MKLVKLLFKISWGLLAAIGLLVVYVLGYQYYYLNHKVPLCYDQIVYATDNIDVEYYQKNIEVDEAFKNVEARFERMFGKDILARAPFKDDSVDWFISLEYDPVAAAYYLELDSTRSQLDVLQDNLDLENQTVAEIRILYDQKLLDYTALRGEYEIKKNIYSQGNIIPGKEIAISEDEIIILESKLELLINDLHQLAFAITDVALDTGIQLIDVQSLEQEYRAAQEELVGFGRPSRYSFGHDAIEGGFTSVVQYAHNTNDLESRLNQLFSRVIVHKDTDLINIGGYGYENIPKQGLIDKLIGITPDDFVLRICD